MKKQVIAIFITILLLFSASGCAWSRKVNYITPSYNAVKGIVIQKTYQDENEKVTYKEKKISDTKDITDILDKLNSVAVERQSAIEYNHVDFLVLYEGAKDHRLIVCDGFFIYDGTAYLPKNEKQKNIVSEIYNKLNYEETEASSRLFN